MDEVNSALSKQLPLLLLLFVFWVLEAYMYVYMYFLFPFMAALFHPLFLWLKVYSESVKYLYM